SCHAGTCYSDDAKDVAFDASKENVRSIEHSRGRFRDRVQRALAVFGCTGNNAEDVSRRGLAVEAFAQLIEQPRVLDGNDGLGGEVLHLRNLFINKGASLPTTDANTADSLLIAK